MNTKVSYHYADASNYKQWGEAVLKGEVSGAEISAVFEDHLYDNEFFIPEEVGLDGLQSGFGDLRTDDDHPFHYLDSIERTEERADSSAMSAREFVEKMLLMSQDKWEKAGVNWNTRNFGLDI